MRADRLAALDWLEGELDLALAGPGPAPADGPPRRDDRGLRPPARAVRAADRGQPRSTSASAATRPGRSCAATARCRPTRSASSCSASSARAKPARIALSDPICTALQLTEHCQDVAEDLARGRVYLPLEDLARFGCAAEELGARTPRRRAARGARVRGRSGAAGCCAKGAAARRSCAAARGSRSPRFVAGGRAALDAIERAGYDVLAGPPARRRRAALLARARSRRLARTRAGGAGERARSRQAYARCEAITREQAANFYYGIRLLSGERRRAMCAVYAFARRIDDIGDGTLAERGRASCGCSPREAARGGARRRSAPDADDPVMRRARRRAHALPAAASTRCAS